jgi:hypothetical protein
MTCSGSRAGAKVLDRCGLIGCARIRTVSPVGVTPSDETPHPRRRYRITQPSDIICGSDPQNQEYKEEHAL